MNYKFRAYLSHATDILMVISSFMIAFGFSGLEFESESSKRNLLIKEDCARWSANLLSSKELATKYNLLGNEESLDSTDTSVKAFCPYYD